jgi:hypothetical protein
MKESKNVLVWWEKRVSVVRIWLIICVFLYEKENKKVFVLGEG